MRSILGKMILAPVVMAAAALATNTAMAEAVTVKVPFSFTVAGKLCPAGLYTVQRDGVSHIVTLQSKNASRIFGWVVGPGAPDPTDTRIRLRFDEDGDSRALQSVQYGPLITRNLDKHTHSEHAQVRIIEGQRVGF
jgi:hypothetical protein